MGPTHLPRILLVLLLPSLLVCGLATVADTQGLQTSPYSAPSMLRGLSGGGLGSPGSSAPGAGGSSSLYVSEQMLRDILPLIPNLQFGYLYDFGSNRVSQGRFTADYLLPLSLGRSSTVFGEAHTEFQSFRNTKSGFSSGVNNRVDISLGGAYRTFLRRDTLLGVNGFYDTSRLGGTWYSSGSVGLEMAALLPGNDAIDLNFNWYGQLFNSNVIVNAFRHGPSNFDFQAGYSHELWNGGPDLRLSATGYKFEIGNSVYGWNAGAELKSRDGMFVLKDAVGHDRVDKTYQTVGGFLNVGFQPENLLRGESPLIMPEPIFKSPRSLWYMFTQIVKRDWHQPAAVILAKQATSASVLVRFRLTLINNLAGAALSPTVLTGSGTLTEVGDVFTKYQLWQLDFVGDTSALPDPVPVTVSSGSAVAANRWTTNQNEVVVLNFPRGGGGTVGFGGSVLNGGDRPFLTVGSPGLQGTVTFSAAGVETMAVQIVQ